MNQPITGQYPDDDSAVDVEGVPELDPRLGGLSEEQLLAIHKLGIKRYHAAVQAWSAAHASYVADQKFADGEQWDEAVAAARRTANLSVLVYNQLPAKYKYIVNNARRAMPAIRCSPTRGGATINTAKVLDGLVKAASNKSNAKHAYIHALTCAVIGGLGAWRVQPVECEDDYGDDGVTDIDVTIDRVLNPCDVLMDPAAIKQDFSDAEYCFVVTSMPRELHDETYGEEAEGFDANSAKDMFDADSVKVLEYWVKDKTTRTVQQYILNGARVLSVNTEYRGKYIPIVLVTGEEKHIDGKRSYKGIVRDVKDMQILLNLAKSKTGDYLGRTGNQTWLVEEGQIEGYESIWLESNVNGAAVLPYKATAAGAPQRLEAPAPPVGFQQISSEADADIRAAIGIRDPLETIPANLATKTVEIQVSQSNIGTLEFIDRLKDAVCWGGKITVDLIIKYYEGPQVREIMGLDGQMQTVQLNQAYTENGEMVMHDLQKGVYTVLISDGPSYESQRSEASDKLMECAKVYPQFMSLAGDIVFRNQDFDGAQEIADRLRSQLPPQVLAASSASNADGSGNKQVMQNQMMQMQQQFAQLQEQNQQLNQMLQQAVKEKETKAAEVQIKTEAEIQLEQLRHTNAMQLEQLRLNGKLTQDEQGQTADMRREVLKGHTDVFKAQLQHNAANVTPLDDVPVTDIDPVLRVMDEISVAATLPNLFAQPTTSTPTTEQL